MRALGTHAACLAALLLAGTALPAAADPIDVTSSQVAAFQPGSPETKEFGKLRFLGGLQMDSPDDRFGGLSGIEVSPDGRSALMVSDTGHFFRATIEAEGERPTGLSGVNVESLTDEAGRTLENKGGADAESLRGRPANALDRVLVGFERRNRVLAYDVAGDGSPTGASLVKTPDAVRKLPHNQGLEAIALAPGPAPEAGSIVMFGESAGDDERLHGWILGPDGTERGSLSVTASEAFSATDAVFLDTGDMILLERRFNPLTGVAMRLRRFKGADIVPGAVLDGEELITAPMNYVVDNMEGIAFHRDADGRAILTIVSDDNFNLLQRNLLLRFELVE